MRIDWASLARMLGLSIRVGGAMGEIGGTREARAALAHIIGDEALRASVDHYVACFSGSELARSVLWLLHPPAAMERCFEIFRESSDLEDRRTAIELLRVVADERALAWVPLFLADPDEGIQNWGIGIVDQLLFSHFIDVADAEAILALADRHPNAYVREQAGLIREQGHEPPADPAES